MPTRKAWCGSNRMNELESRMGDLLANGDWVLADLGRAGAEWLLSSPESLAPF
jgi:hypothetical protein